MSRPPMETGRPLGKENGTPPAACRPDQEALSFLSAFWIS